MFIHIGNYICFHICIKRDIDKPKNDRYWSMCSRDFMYSAIILSLGKKKGDSIFFFFDFFREWFSIAPLSRKKFFLVLFFWSFLGLFSIMVIKYIYKRRLYTSYILLFSNTKKPVIKKGPKKDQKGPKRTKKDQKRTKIKEK